jgi:hypothetical protein
MNAARPHHRARGGLFFICAAALLLAGCGHMRYQGDSNGFNDAYADASNRQMLLNLARLDQHDPTYFLQFGQISVSYQFSTTLNGTVNNTVPSGLRVPILSETGVLGAGASTQPSFTFIPVNDQLVAQELLQPVNSQVLFSLFEEGAPVDELLRLMVERMEIQLPNQTTSEVFTNSLVDDNSPVHDGVQSYAVFLKVCAIARQLQLADCLELKMVSKFKEVAKGWSTETLKSTDIVNARDKGLVYKHEKDGKWHLGSMQMTPKFILKPGSYTDSILNKLEATNCYSKGASLKNMVAILKKGFTVEGNVTNPPASGAGGSGSGGGGGGGSSSSQDDSASGGGGPGGGKGGGKGGGSTAQSNDPPSRSEDSAPASDYSDSVVDSSDDSDDSSNGEGSRLVLRSFLLILTAASQEQNGFENYFAHSPYYDLTPPEERQPILKIRWGSGDGPTITPLMALLYRGTSYEITDRDTGKFDQQATWNRDVFRLIVQLASQVSVDISKFPLPTSLQVLPSP